MNFPIETTVSNKDCYIFRLGAAVRKFQLGYVAAKKAKMLAVTTQIGDRMEGQMATASNPPPTTTSVSNSLTATMKPTFGLSTVSTSEESGSTRVATSKTNGTTGLAIKAIPANNLIEASTGNEHIAVNTNGTFNPPAEIIPSISIKVEKDSDDETGSNQAIEQAEALSLNVTIDSKVNNDAEHLNFINDIAEEVSTAAINSNLPEANRSTVSMTEEEIERRIKNIIAAANHWQKNNESSNGSIKRKLSTHEAGTIKRIKSEDLDLSSEEGLYNKKNCF